MQIKNNIKTLIILFLSLFVFNINLCAEEFNITAKEILLDKENKIVKTHTVYPGGKQNSTFRIVKINNRRALLKDINRLSF